MAEIFTVYAEEKNTANVLICKQVLKQIPMPSPNSGANLQMPSSHIYYNFRFLPLLFPWHPVFCSCSLLYVPSKHKYGTLSLFLAFPKDYINMGHCRGGYSCTRHRRQLKIRGGSLFLHVLADPASGGHWTFFFHPCLSPSGWAPLWVLTCYQTTKSFKSFVLLLQGMKPPSKNLLFPAEKS